MQALATTPKHSGASPKGLHRIGPLGVTMSVIAQLLEFAADHKASDIFLMSGRAPQLRIGGILRSLNGAGVFDQEMDQELQSLSGRLSDDCTDQVISMPWVGRFRIRRLATKSGPVINIRIHGLDDIDCGVLGLPERFLNFFDAADEGLVLVTGFSGSGLTTSISALVNRSCRNAAWFGTMFSTTPTEIDLTHNPFLRRHRYCVKSDDFLQALAGEGAEGSRVVGIDLAASPAALEHALRLSDCGRKVICGITAGNVREALSQAIYALPSGEEVAKNRLSRKLIGVLGQLWCRTTSGQRTLAFEMLQGTPAIRSQIGTRGIQFSLHSAIMVGHAGGLGMQLFEQDVSQLLKSGVIDVPEAASHGVQLDHPLQPAGPIVDVDPAAHELSVEGPESDQAFYSRQIRKIAGFRYGLVLISGEADASRQRFLENFVQSAMALPNRVAVVITKDEAEVQDLSDSTSGMLRVPWNAQYEAFEDVLTRVRRFGAEIVVYPAELLSAEESSALHRIAMQGALVISMLPAGEVAEEFGAWVGRLPAPTMPLSHPLKSYLRAILTTDNADSDRKERCFVIGASLTHVIAERDMEKLSGCLASMKQWS